MLLISGSFSFYISATAYHVSMEKLTKENEILWQLIVEYLPEFKEKLAKESADATTPEDAERYFSIVPND